MDLLFVLESGSLTPPSAEKLKKVARSEPRFNSFRKSLRKRSKKDADGDAAVEVGGKENKIQKIDKQRPESMLSLEEQFLPEVMKQRKEQEELHGVTNEKSPDEKCPKIGQRVSSSSLDGRSEVR